MKKLAWFAVAVSLLAWMMACASSRYTGGLQGGGSGGGGGTGLAAGNWALNASGGIRGDIWFGGYLSQTNATVSGKLWALGTQCFPIIASTTPMSVTGTVNGTALSLSGTLATGETVTFNLTVPSGSAVTTMNGTYAVSGGVCDSGDTGAISASTVANISGTWAGPIISSNGNISIAFTEATTPTNGGFPLTLTGANPLSFTGVTGCTVTGTLGSTTSSFVAGDIVVLNITTSDNGVAGTLLALGTLDNSTAPTTLTVNYVYQGGTNCFFNNANQGTYGTGLFTLSKQ